MSYANRFKLLFIFCGLSAYYMPESDSIIPGGKKIPFLYIISILINLNFCVNCVDWGLVSMTPNLPVAHLFFSGFCFGCYLWVALKSQYFICKWRKHREIYQFWEERLASKKHMENEIEKAVFRNKMAFLYGFGILIFPDIILGCYKLATSTLYMVSNLNYNIYTFSSPFYLSIHQVIAGLTFCNSWVAYMCSLTLILDLVSVEIKYLNAELQRICEDFTKCCHGSQTRGDALKIAMKRLGKWIDYHVLIIRLNGMVKTFFGPLLFGDCLFFSFGLSGLLYCTAADLVPSDASLICKIMMATLMSMTFYASRIGDEIKDSSARLHEVVTLQNTYDFPQEVKRAFLLISLRSQKPLLMDFKSNLPLTSNTFQRVCILQYRVLRFIQDVRN